MKKLRMEILLSFFLVCNFYSASSVEHNYSNAVARHQIGSSNASQFQEIAPYLIPNDHPLKAKLDNLFSKPHILLNKESLLEAGFIAAEPRPYTRVVVARHKDFPGTIFKFFIETNRHDCAFHDHHYWAQRVIGARYIQSEVNRRGWQDTFKVPVKWVYALPKTSNRQSPTFGREFILIEDDMEIYDNLRNDRLWKTAITHEHLTKLFILVKKLGLNDSLKPGNVSFSYDGRLAFVDTQCYFSQVDYKKLLRYLNTTQKEFWNQLIMNPPE